MNAQIPPHDGGQLLAASLWDHDCCGSRYWSAARLCDWCGAPAVVSVANVSIKDAMARLHSLDPRPNAPNRRAINRDDEDELPDPRPAGTLHPDFERALVFGLWLLSGLVCTFLGIGAFVEFERGNYVRSFTCAVSAAAAPASIIAFAIDGWLKHHRAKVQGFCR